MPRPLHIPAKDVPECNCGTTALVRIPGTWPLTRRLRGASLPFRKLTETVSALAPWTPQPPVANALFVVGTFAIAYLEQLDGGAGMIRPQFPGDALTCRAHGHRRRRDTHALANIVKHGQARRVSVTLARRNDELHLSM